MKIALNRIQRVKNIIVYVDMNLPVEMDFTSLPYTFLFTV